MKIKRPTRGEYRSDYDGRCDYEAAMALWILARELVNAGVPNARVLELTARVNRQIGWNALMVEDE